MTYKIKDIYTNKTAPNKHYLGTKMCRTGPKIT